MTIATNNWRTTAQLNSGNFSLLPPLSSLVRMDGFLFAEVPKSGRRRCRSFENALHLFRGWQSKVVLQCRKQLSCSKESNCSNLALMLLRFHFRNRRLFRQDEVAGQTIPRTFLKPTWRAVDIQCFLWTERTRSIPCWLSLQMIYRDLPMNQSIYPRKKYSAAIRTTVG